MAKICVISASPRVNGKSIALAEDIFNDAIENFRDEEHFFISLADMYIEGCTGCDVCKNEGHVCKIEDDDASDIIDCIKSCDVLEIVSPIYFAGVPSQFKALLDRFQPMYWANIRNTEEKRPAFIHLVGDGGDKYGYDGAVLTLKSALSVAGFEIKDIDIQISKGIC